MKRRIKAELILASQNAITGDILYTFKLTFPRIILAEVNTHTVISKNTASSRAIPVPKMMAEVRRDPFIPVKWGTYQKGMQAGPELTGWKRKLAVQVWKLGRWADLAEAWFDHYVLHLAKEITNRIYERFIWTEQVFTTTDLNNLIALRHHWMAEPHFQICAADIHAYRDAVVNYLDSNSLANGPNYTPIMVNPNEQLDYEKVQSLIPGQWHLPFVGRWSDVVFAHKGYYHKDELLPPDVTLELKKVSAGRCAWVSYFMPGDNDKKMADHAPALSTYSKLAEGDPKHLSPLQHQGTPLPHSLRCGNFCGFLQFRKEIPTESGGDRVVPSITPSAAVRMVEEYVEGVKILDQLIEKGHWGPTEG